MNTSAPVRTPHSLNAKLLAALTVVGATAPLLQAQTNWSGTLNGTAENWNVNSNWSPASFPNAIGASANLTVDYTANKAISLQQAITVGSLTLGDSNATSPSTLTINSGTGTNALTLDATSGNATVTSSGGSNTISTNLVLTDSVDLTTTSALTLSGTISGAGAINKLATAASSITLSGNNTGWSGGIRHERGTINMTGAAGNVVLGTGTFTFANADGVASGNTLSLNTAASKTITNNFVQNNADNQTGSEYAQISVSGGSSGFRVLTFTGDFSTGSNFFGGTGANANGQSLFLNAQTGTGTAANESSFVFTGDWSGYNAIAGGLATTNTGAFRLQSGSYVFDKSAASANAAGGFQLQSTDTVVSGKLILSEDTTTLANPVQFTNATGVRHAFGSSAGASSTVTASGAITVSAAPGASLFALNPTAKFVASGLISGSGAGGIEINRSYTYTSADTVNSTQNPTGTVIFSRAVGNTYTGNTTVTAGTLLVNNTSGSGTGTGSISVAASATLGGTGFIVPTGANGVTVSGILSPGTPGVANDIGSLTFNGGSTTGALLSLASGSSVSFNLGASNTSDTVRLYNYAGATDFVPTGSISLNFLGATAGTYTLFSFFSDAGITAATSGISSGLTLGSGLTGFTTALNYGTSAITLTLTEIPEPASFAALAGLGALGLVAARRRRR
jgi:PEP-CTERM motif